MLFPFWDAKKRKEESAKKLTEIYAYPLSVTSINLFYRLKEMILEGRFAYLKETNRSNDFSEYKYVSSLYRMASLLGWVRALKLEQASLLFDGSCQRVPIVELVSGVEKSLADGSHAEADIVKSLAKLWAVSLPENKTEIERIAARTDHIIGCVFGVMKQDNNTDADKFLALRGLADNFSQVVGCINISNETLRDTFNKAIRVVSPRQAWIYRDWQAAIGDMVLKPNPDSFRRYRVISYAEFETLYKDDSLWIKRLSGIFDGVDFGEDLNDYRVPQLKDVLKSLAILVLEIDKLEIGGKPFGKKNVQDAHQVLRQLGNRA